MSSLVATLEGVGFWATGLPSWDAARDYVAYVSRALGLPIELVGVGAARDRVLA